jgi:hypothetical protein
MEQLIKIGHTFLGIIGFITFCLLSALIIKEIIRLWKKIWNIIMNL